MKPNTYLRHSVENIAVFRCLLNVSFSSTVLMPPGALFQLMGPWQENVRCPYDFVLAAAMLRIFGSNNERSGLEYTHSTALTDILDMQQSTQCSTESQSCKQFYCVLVANVTVSEDAQYNQFLVTNTILMIVKTEIWMTYVLFDYSNSILSGARCLIQNSREFKIQLHALH